VETLDKGKLLTLFRATIHSAQIKQEHNQHLTICLEVPVPLKALLTELLLPLKGLQTRHNNVFIVKSGN